MDPQLKRAYTDPQRDPFGHTGTHPDPQWVRFDPISGGPLMGPTGYVIARMS